MVIFNYDIPLNCINSFNTFYCVPLYMFCKEQTHYHNALETFKTFEYIQIFTFPRNIVYSLPSHTLILFHL